MAKISGRLEDTDVDEIAVLGMTNDTRHEVNQSGIVCGVRMGADIDLVKFRSRRRTVFVDDSRYRHRVVEQLSPHYEIAWRNAAKRSIPPPLHADQV